MYTRKMLYGMIALAAMLLTGCSADVADVAEFCPTTSETEKAIPISFNCTIANDNDNTTRSANGYTGIIDNENKELFYTGFGVFASQSAEVAPDLMYNQKVDYTFLADGSGNGYWTYSPLKYWPADVSSTYLCAYAPYVPTPAADDGTTTGIIGMSDNDETTPSITYRRCLHPEENVDLLWCYFAPSEREVAKIELHHALARLRVNLTLTSVIPANTKVLLRRVTLSGNIAKTGDLDLTGHTTNAGGKLIPTWNNQDTEETVTIFTDHDPETNNNSYGNLTESLRYISGMPYKWQPAGLEKDTKVNIICMGDYPSYVYLIPQSSLTLSCTVDYCLVTASDVTNGSKTTSAATLIAEPLNGNTTYDLNLTFAI